VSIRIKFATHSHDKAASRSPAKPANILHGKTTTRLSLLIPKLLIAHSGEIDRFRIVSLEIPTLAGSNNQPPAVI
jgi:hypothetical protein